jgi:Arc/MetJ family transcription regulator
MQVTIEINDHSLAEAFSVSKAKSKKNLIHEALGHYIRLRKGKGLKDLAGKVHFYEGFVPKKRSHPHNNARSAGTLGVSSHSAPRNPRLARTARAC